MDIFFVRGMKVQVLTIFGELYAGQASEVVLPGDDGEFCIKDFHPPFVYRLTEGRLTLRDARDKRMHSIEIKDGVAHMADNELAVMVEV